MTSELLHLLPLVGIGAGLLWLALGSLAAFGGRALHAANPLWRRFFLVVLSGSLGARAGWQGRDVTREESFS